MVAREEETWSVKAQEWPVWTDRGVVRERASPKWTTGEWAGPEPVYDRRRRVPGIAGSGGGSATYWHVIVYADSDDGWSQMAKWRCSCGSNASVGYVRLSRKDEAASPMRLRFRV